MSRDSLDGALKDLEYNAAAWLRDNAASEEEIDEMIAKSKQAIHQWHEEEVSAAERQILHWVKGTLERNSYQDTMTAIDRLIKARPYNPKLKGDIDD